MRAVAHHPRRIAVVLATALVVGAHPAIAQQGTTAQPPPAPEAPAQPAPEAPPNDTPPAAPAEPSAPPPETPASEAPPAASESAPIAPEAAAPGVITLSVRVQETLIAAEVLVDGQLAGPTSTEAAVQLSLTPGAHTLRINIPPGAMPQRADQTTALGIDVPVNVVAGQPQEVNVAVDSHGDILALDVHPTVVTETASETTPDSAPAEQGLPAKLRGRIVLSTTREPIVGAKVYVRRTSFEGVTDAQGLFTIDLPAGSYDLAIVHPNYATVVKDKVRVSVQKNTQLLLELTPSPNTPDDFTITAKYVRGGVAALLEERRNASTVQDAIGSEDIAKSPDSTASSATRRVVGASIVGGQFLLVRGLGGRYSNVRLNGVPLPSTDPDLPGFQIDLFPASLLSNLTITKTFSADIPGDFAGGSLNVVTKDFPDKFTLGVSVGASYNTETTGRKILDYEGGDTDLLGFDDGTRELPKDVPDQKVSVSREGFDRDQVQALGQLYPNHWKYNRSTALPNLSLSASLGNTIKLGEERKLGYLLTLGYRASFQRYLEDVTSVKLDPAGLSVRDQLRREVADQEAQIGILGTGSYEPVENHKVTLVSLLTQTANDRTNLVTGTPEAVSREVRTTQLRFIERQLLFNQLLGEHKELFGSLKVNWQLNMAMVARDQPDTRDLVYAREPNNGPRFQFESGAAGSGERLYSKLGQKDFGGGLDLTFPVWSATGKSGYLGRVSSRDFAARKFAFDLARGAPDDSEFLPPEELFEPGNLADPDRILDFEELTAETDGYKASQSSHAGYLMMDVPAFDETLRIIPGLRAEAFHQEIRSASPVEVTDEDIRGTDRSDIDWLPAGALVVNLTDKMAIRGGYGGTVAYPLLRELAPFVNQDYLRARTVRGNPDLKRTFIHNFDLRWELFPSGTEVLAASAFYKIFEHPIESVVLDTGGNLTFENIEGADNYGLELETRFSLERFSDALKDFSVLANLAIVRSRVELSEDQLRVATSKKRPLAGQSPYVANLSIGYSSEDSGLSAYVYYNVFGRRLQDVGRLGLPDVYEEPFHSVDMSAFWKIDSHWTLGVSGTNLLMQPTVVTQGDFDYSRYNKGSTYGAKLAWSY